jgi:glycine hydroxymethyltransferase
MNNVALAKMDPAVAHIIKQEAHRLESTIDLIASENYTWPAVLEASGSILTNKYAEGYPGRRYYGGCVYVDEVEDLARQRCAQLFDAEHVNVQPHAGSQANMAVYFAALKPGDTILGMNLAAGGHLTHGYPINFSGTFYKNINYGVNRDTECLDYDEIQKLALEHKPKMIVCGASAYSQIIDFEKFAAIAKSVDAFLLTDIAHIAGLVAAGLHPSPIKHADFVSSTTHKTLRGPRGGLVMCKEPYAQQLDKAVMPGLQGGPLMQQIGAKAVGFLYALQPEFKTYQKQIIENAQTMADAFTSLGYRIVSGSTKNHLMVIDLRNKNITGKEAEELLGSIGISLNRNCIPFDPQKPLITSGIRVGTPAITSRGFKKEETEEIVHIIHDALQKRTDLQALNTLAEQVHRLCKRFPVYEGM